MNSKGYVVIWSLVVAIIVGVQVISIWQGDYLLAAVLGIPSLVYLVFLVRRAWKRRRVGGRNES